MTQMTTDAKAAWESKINWTQIISVLAMGLTMFGIDLDADIQQRLALTISSLAAAVTIVWRTWFTNKTIL
ncbi:hypothetical protein [uncultured Cohaesibacter sp.]|uniref:hypothetical protein n=1 Tax=uncultured Cohaesibacter sp. TaxID=1002546 RepID=UPI00292D358D|nr:hypothetical protein [uncultured Cohaesibacter sp.]